MANAVFASDSSASDSPEPKYYCPWAGMVIRVELDRKAKQVSILSSDGVRWKDDYKYTLHRIKIGAADVDEFRFAVPSSNYWYTFALQHWVQADFVQLNNVRLNTETNKTWKESGLCYVER